jgi:hypothetical protein
LYRSAAGFVYGVIGFFFPFDEGFPLLQSSAGLSLLR